VTATRKTGSIARLFPDRVYGFIHCPEDQRDYFFHSAQLDGVTFHQLVPGDEMSFIVAEGIKGTEAQDVQLARHNEVTGRETREQVGLPTLRTKPVKRGQE
jgi:cold shock CspA family protein